MSSNAVMGAAALPPPKRPSLLSRVTKGPVSSPIKIVVYGVPGVGKSTFAAGAPDPIFMGEDGSKELDVARFPQPESWQQLLDMITDLTLEAHSYRTLVLDTLDWAEPMCWAHTCLTKPGDKGKRCLDIEDYGYKRGYVAALDVWKRLTDNIDHLQAKRGMHVVMLAQCSVRTPLNPEGDDFSKYGLKLHEKAGYQIGEWADGVLFAAHEVLTHERDGRAKGISTGLRQLRTEKHATYDAKNRYGLPATLPLDWRSFEDAVAVARARRAPAAVRARIVELLKSAAPDVVERVNKALATAKDDDLPRIENHLAAILATTPEPPPATTQETAA